MLFNYFEVAILYMQKVVVLKIGGGVLKDKNAFDRIVKIVSDKKNRKESQIIVISALYGVTDYLIESITKCFDAHHHVTEVIDELKKMHLNYLEYISNKQIREEAESAIKDKLSVLEKMLYGISYLKEVTPRSKDFIQSFGERLSPIVLETFLLDNAIKAEFVDAEEAGILCIGPYENALVDLTATEKNLKQKIGPLLNDKIVLLPGYYGIDSSGEVKTFGRGGTDYSAGFITNIFDAELEIWKDVSGFMTADPKVVSGAKQIVSLSYSEAEELGYLGAKILHPKTIDPLRQKGLFAEIKNIFAPEVKGTIISGKKQKDSLIVKSIASTKNVAAITIASTGMVNVSGFASIVFSKLAEKEISVDLIVTSEATITFSVEGKQLKKALEAMQEILRVCTCKISHLNDLSMIGVIGEGMAETVGISARVFNALARENINIELISQGASEINISFLVKQEALDNAVKAVHKEFFK